METLHPPRKRIVVRFHTNKKSHEFLHHISMLTSPSNSAVSSSIWCSVSLNVIASCVPPDPLCHHTDEMCSPLNLVVSWSAITQRKLTWVLSVKVWDFPSRGFVLASSDHKCHSKCIFKCLMKCYKYCIGALPFMLFPLSTNGQQKHNTMSNTPTQYHFHHS